MAVKNIFSSQEEGLPELSSSVMESEGPSCDNPYAGLGELEPVNLISFAYQIASGLVCVYVSQFMCVHINF